MTNYIVEEFRQIADYPRYLVSTKGRVYDSKRDKFLKLSPVKYGYLTVHLCNENGRRTHGVHRLVAEAFLYKWSPYLQVNHIDENPSNNDVENLEYVSCKDNINHGTRTEKAITNGVATKYAKGIVTGISKDQNAYKARKVINKTTGEITTLNAVYHRMNKNQTTRDQWDFVD